MEITLKEKNNALSSVLCKNYRISLCLPSLGVSFLEMPTFIGYSDISLKGSIVFPGYSSLRVSFIILGFGLDFYQWWDHE
jgi:hypothetical protein